MGPVPAPDRAQGGTSERIAARKSGARTPTFQSPTLFRTPPSPFSRKEDTRPHRSGALPTHRFAPFAPICARKEQVNVGPRGNGKGLPPFSPPSHAQRRHASCDPRTNPEAVRPRLHLKGGHANWGRAQTQKWRRPPWLFVISYSKVRTHMLESSFFPRIFAKRSMPSTSGIHVL